MKILHLVCKMCGAPMEVALRRAGRATKLECEFCGSTALVQDEVERGPTTGNDTGASVELPAGSIFKNPELVLLDSNWRRERRRFEEVDARGRRHAPSSEATAMLFGFALIIAIVGLAATFSAGLSHETFYFLVAAVSIVIAAFSNGKRSNAYARARKRYRRKRAELTKAIKERAKCG